MWDNLLVQTELTINLLWKATLNPSMSAWEYFNWYFYCIATPLGTIGCKIIIHTTSNKRKSWDQRGRKGFSVGPELQNYRRIQEIDSKTKSLIITYAAEYLQEYLTQPHVMEEDIITRAIHLFSVALEYVPTSICDSQLSAIEAAQTIFENWRTVKSLPHEAKKSITTPHTSHTKAGSGAATATYTHLQGWPRKKDIHNFQGCSTTKVTHNSKKTPK